MNPTGSVPVIWKIVAVAVAGRLHATAKHYDGQRVALEHAQSMGRSKGGPKAAPCRSRVIGRRLRTDARRKPQRQRIPTISRNCAGLFLAVTPLPQNLIAVVYRKVGPDHRANRLDLPT
jgi:hypothetical protein